MADTVQYILSPLAAFSIYYFLFKILIHKIISSDDIGWTMKYFHIAIITSLIFTLILHYYFVFEMGFAEGLDFGVGTDTVAYDMVARSFVKSFKESGQYYLQGVHEGATGYSIFLAINYYLFGESALAGTLINVVMYGMTVVLASHISCLLFDSVIGKRTAFLMCCFTTFIFYSGHLIKEILVLFLLLTAILNMVNMASKITTLRVIVFFLTSIAIYLTRQWLLFVFIVSGFFYYAYIFRERLNFIKTLLIASIAIFPIFIINYTILGISAGYFLYDADVQVMINRNEYIWFHGYLTYLTFLLSNVGYFFQMIFFGLWSFWLHPFFLFLPIWDAPYGYGVLHTFDHMGSFLWWLLLPAIFYGLYHIALKGKKISLIILLFILVGMAFIVLFRPGAIRYKYFLMPFFLMAASVGINYIDRWYNIVKYYLLTIVIISIYLVPKWAHGSDHFQLLMIIMIIFTIFAYFIYRMQFDKKVRSDLESTGS